MLILVKPHYLCAFQSDIEVPSEAIATYYRAAHPSLRFEFAKPVLHSIDKTGIGDFFDKTKSNQEYCAEVSRVIDGDAPTSTPTLHLLISSGSPKLFGEYPDGAILNKQRTAVAIFLGSRNFKRRYRNRIPDYPKLWSTFYFQVCIHEIGHALTWTHGIQPPSVLRHIMLQSQLRGVKQHAAPWKNASYARPKLAGKPIQCHPLPDPALEDLKRPERLWVPGGELSFKEETLCP